MASMSIAIGDRLAAWSSALLARPRTTACVTLLLGALAAFYAAGNLGVNTDTANMIAPTLPWRQHFNEFRDTFPIRDRNLIVVIDAPTPLDADHFAKSFLAELRREPELYRSPLMAGEGEFFERNGLLYLPANELAKLGDRVAAAQPLIGLLQARFDGAAVLDVATRTLTTPGSDLGATAPLYAELARAMRDVAQGRGAALDWSALIAAGDAATTRHLIVLQPAFDFSKMQPAADAIEGIRDIAERLNAAAEVPVSVRLTGSVAMEHEELLSVSRGAGFGALATLGLVALVLFASLRSWRLLVISLVTLLTGLSLTAAFAAVAVGQLNLLSVAFVVLNVGLGSDYVIHVLLRYRELTAEGHAMHAALVTTMRDVGSSLVLCAVTTAAGFYSFIPTTFSGVSELGLIAGTGVFFGLFVSVTLLPALVMWWGDRNPRRAASTWIDPKFLAPLAQRPRAVLGVTAVVIVGTFALLPRVTFDSNPIHLRDPNSESVTTLLDLAEDGEAPLLNLVAVMPNHAAALTAAASLRDLPEVRSVITTAQLVPDDQEEKLAVLADLELLLGSGFAELEKADYDANALSRALEALAAAAQGVPVAAEVRAAATALEAQLAAATPAARDAALRELDRALTARLPEQLARLERGLHASAFDRADLPPALTERWLTSDERELIEITPEEDVSDNEAARRFIAAVHGVVPRATGLPVVYQEASATVVGAFERALLYAFVMVSLIILIVLRRGKDTLLVLAPIAIATLVTAALTVLIDMPFNYANIIALPLLVGIGVDNGIHVVHRMHADSAHRLFDTSTMRAVLASALTTIASFGNLAFSSHAGTASMGVLLALGLVASMVATLIVLPAWLVLTSRTRGAVA
jgi:hypothetical protein